ncbi:MAG: D-tyrosyl-tRNA(Tyr) deacylase [Halobacteriovoraceae bacterium]|nr:D-tyrosyl-tRNA(Tyr) deacylase [Halobacteriovoraceae bacterium]|tara:strand:- start:5380 stop:5817 length:438 start_codon:yes stop_codon:yes gene_type:complete
MKAVVQRVHSAQVEVNQKVVGKIGQGYLIYICFELGDTKQNMEKLIKKILNLRVFEDENEKMNLSLSDVSGQILSVSQFTLSWDGKKGHRPSFDKSMPPNEAKVMYKFFNDELKKAGIQLEMGRFGAQMNVSSINDGPVTFFLDY